MGVYGRWIVPRLLDLAMRNRLLDHYRHQTIASARGLVLEVGVGSGVNLPLYGPAVTHVFGLDPSPELLRLARKRAADMAIPVSLLRASAERARVASDAGKTLYEFDGLAVESENAWRRKVTQNLGGKRELT